MMPMQHGASYALESQPLQWHLRQPRQQQHPRQPLPSRSEMPTTLEACRQAQAEQSDDAETAREDTLVVILEERGGRSPAPPGHDALGRSLGRWSSTCSPPQPGPQQLACVASSSRSGARWAADDVDMDPVASSGSGDSSESSSGPQGACSQMVVQPPRVMPPHSQHCGSVRKLGLGAAEAHAVAAEAQPSAEVHSARAVVSTSTMAECPTVATRVPEHALMTRGVSLQVSQPSVQCAVLGPRPIGLTGPFQQQQTCFPSPMIAFSRACRVGQ